MPNINRKVILGFAVCAAFLTASTVGLAIPRPGAPLDPPARPGDPAVQIDPKKISDTPCAAFAAWLEKFRLTTSNKSAMETEGLSLARQRRDTMLQLFDGDPERAMTWKISAADRALLPAAILTLVEKPVSGCGPFDVLAGSTSDSKTGGFRVVISRYATLNAKPYKVRVYGRRQGLATKYDVPMHGIAFDNVLLLHPDALRTSEPGEVAPDGAKCPYCEQPVTQAAVTAQWGGQVFAFDSVEHFRKVENEIERREAVIGPKEGYPCGTPLDKIVAALKERELKAEGDFTEDRRDKPFGDK